MKQQPSVIQTGTGPTPLFFNSAGSIYEVHVLYVLLYHAARHIFIALLALSYSSIWEYTCLCVCVCIVCALQMQYSSSRERLAYTRDIFRYICEGFVDLVATESGADLSALSTELCDSNRRVFFVLKSLSCRQVHSVCVFYVATGSESKMM